MRMIACPGGSLSVAIGSVAGQAFPEFAELPSKFAIVQIAQSLARDHHDIPAGQAFLIEAEGFADLTLDAVALDSELDTLLADHQTKTGMIEFVVARQQQDTFARSFAAWGVEDCLELPGGQQSLFPAEASTHHLSG